MVDKVGHERDVVAGSVLHFERVARNRAVPVGDAHRGGVFGCDGEHGRPVDGRDLGRRISLRDRDSEDPVAGRDIQYAKWTG